MRKPHPVDWTPGKGLQILGRYRSGERRGSFLQREMRPSHRRPCDATSPPDRSGHRVRDRSARGGLVRRGAECVGIDSSQEVLEVARTRNRAAAFYLGSVSHIPIPDCSVDAATLIEVVEHLDDAVLAAALSEARRVLRPGGTLVVTTPNEEDLAASTRECPDCQAEFHIYQHVRSWTIGGLRLGLQQAGFGTVRVSTATFAERGSRWGRVLPLAYRLLGRRPPRLLALATR